MNTGQLRQAMAIVVWCGFMLSGSVVAREATPQAVILPEVAAPYGLGDVALPVSEDEIWEVFNALPVSVAGQPSTQTEDLGDRILISWGAADPPIGPPITLQALSFPNGDFFPVDFTAGQYVAMASQDEENEVTGFGRDGDLVWIQSEIVVRSDDGTVVAPRTLYTLAWGLTDGEVLFTAAATTPEGLEAVVTAFVETAAS